MLAAAPEKSRSLELVKLVLLLVSENEEGTIPAGLKDEFIRIIEQARQLAVDPQTPQEKVIPESIDLALEMQAIGSVSDAIKQVTDFDAITPLVADKLLSAMETHPVYQD